MKASLHITIHQFLIFPKSFCSVLWKCLCWNIPPPQFNAGCHQLPAPHCIHFLKSLVCILCLRARWAPCSNALENKRHRFASCKRYWYVYVFYIIVAFLKIKFYFIFFQLEKNAFTCVICKTVTGVIKKRNLHKILITCYCNSNHTRASQLFTFLNV